MSRLNEELGGILKLDDLDQETLNKLSICGNVLGEDAQSIHAAWREKVKRLPKDLVMEARRFCEAGVVWRHTESEPALRARGIVWIIGLTQIGMEMLAAIRAEDGSGEILRAFLHGVSPNV